MSEIEYRAATLNGVSFPNRIVELIVMPYETETEIVDRDRVFTEIVSRGAFDGIEARNDRMRVRANRDHDVTRTVGRAVKFHPSRPEGLVAEIHISETILGNETLVLADDGVLDASAGFGLLRKNGQTGPVVPDAEVWESRDRRRLNRLYLAHVALTPDPAYLGAKVLAVRDKGSQGVTAQARMTNRERLEVLEWQEQEAVLNTRYSRQ